MEGLRFTDGIDEVYELYPQLEDQGATMIIILAHYGGLNPCTGLAEALDPEHIDLILSGHAEPRSWRKPTASRWSRAEATAQRSVESILL